MFGLEGDFWLSPDLEGTQWGILGLLGGAAALWVGLCGDGRAFEKPMKGLVPKMLILGLLGAGAVAGLDGDRGIPTVRRESSSERLVPLLFMGVEAGLYAGWLGAGGATRAPAGGVTASVLFFLYWVKTPEYVTAACDPASSQLPNWGTVH